MIQNFRLSIPLERLTPLELAAEHAKNPDGKPAKYGFATNVRLGHKGEPVRIWITFLEDKVEPAVMFIGKLHEACAHQWGSGVLDLVDGGFVWLTGTVNWVG